MITPKPSNCLQNDQQRSWLKCRRGFDLQNWSIPLSDLDYGQDEIDAVARVLRSKWISMGPEVESFETEFSALQGARYALAVSSGTAGLHLAFLAANIGFGDEVIQPALNFVAAANMTIACGATPVFADIVSLAEPTVDPVKVEELISPRTKAVVVMHYGGNLCRMAELRALCTRRNILLVEDACHAVGVCYQDASGRPPHGTMAGSIGELGIFSFFSNKNLATGEGGMIVTNRDDLAAKARLLRSHGMTSLTWDRHRGHADAYSVISHGYNYRLDDLHAALGRVQLKKLSANNERRRKLLLSYGNAMDSLSGWLMPFRESIPTSSGHLMVAVAPTAEAHDRAVNHLRRSGVQSSMHYPCIADFEAFAQWRTQPLPVTRQFASRAMTLPLYPAMSDQDVNRVCHLIEEPDSAPAKL
jgi:dTDP-4-amino-4,6-dideoxygalactose transaminase